MISNVGMESTEVVLKSKFGSWYARRSKRNNVEN